MEGLICMRDYVSAKERLKSLEHRKKIKISRLIAKLKRNAFINRLQQKIFYAQTCDSEIASLLIANRQIVNIIGGLNMLILQRHAGESIWINNDIQIVVLGHFRGVTRIGVKAPSEVRIVRDEIKDKEVEHKHG